MDITCTKEYEKLNLLLEQGQFELLLPDTDEPADIRLVYLMNDAVESFLVFKNARWTGTYQAEFEGELDAVLEENENTYTLIVHQEDTVCTIFFDRLVLETHLFNYGQTGHFWVKKYEYLRQLEYRIAVLRDKREYLGEEYCTPTEVKLSYLAEFSPLNFCCYPAVPEKYLVPSGPWWQLTKRAWETMYELADEAGDQTLKNRLKLYRKWPKKCVAKYIAALFHRSNHQGVVRLLTDKLVHEAAIYADRKFTEEEEQEIAAIRQQALKRKKELEAEGKQVEMLREEPFVYARDSIEYKIHLMIAKKQGKNCLVEVETFCR